jgi:hypothetical protein
MRDERLRNATHLFLEFLLATIDPFNVVSHSFAVSKNVTAAINEDVLYKGQFHEIIHSNPFPYILIKYSKHRPNTQHSVGIHLVLETLCPLES